MLRATTACTFSTSQLPKVVREWCVLYILTWKCSSRHNGVHFFDISTSKSGPRMVCFVHFDFKMCFAPQRRATLRSHKSLEKHSVSRLSYLFAHLHLLSSYSFSSTLLSSNLLSSNPPLLSASSLLCFSSVHIVGSLTSKLPSITHLWKINILVGKPTVNGNFQYPCEITRGYWLLILIGQIAKLPGDMTNLHI